MSLSEGLSKGIVAGFSTKTSEGTLAEAPKGFSKKLSLRDFAKDSRDWEDVAQDPRHRNSLLDGMAVFRLNNR